MVHSGGHSQQGSVISMEDGSRVIMAGWLMWISLILQLVPLSGTLGLPPPCPRQCDCTQYNTVDCARMKLQNVPHLSVNTTRLYLDTNDIAEVKTSVFSATPGLLVLSLAENKLEAADTSWFCALRDLQELDLRANNLRIFTIDMDPSCQLTKLKRVDLSSNRLGEIPQNMSHFAPNLEVFNLSLNEIEYSYLGAQFAEMKYLANLDLHGNVITEVAAEDFDPLRGGPLEVLNLANNALDVIEPGAFHSLGNLTSLSLAHNPLQPFSRGLPLADIGLANTSRLTHLDLRDVMLVNLSASTMRGLSNLVTLDAASNRLEKMEPELFSVLPNLETLQLDNNRLEKLTGLAQLSKLRHLYLRNNQLRDLSLKGLHNLEQVDVSKNAIQKLSAGWVTNTPSFQLLNISNNFISSVEADVFVEVKLHHLDFSHNQLTKLSSLGSLRVSKLCLANNWLKGVAPDAFKDLAASVEVLDLSHNRLEGFPDTALRDFVQLQELNLAYNQLGKAFTQEKLGALFRSLSHLQILNLAHNDIVSLPHQQFQFLHHLTTLYLQNNQITSLVDLSLKDMNTLAKLVVSDNQLEVVDTGVLSSLEYLEVIDLAGNPYRCGCEILPYLHWLNTTLVEVLFLKNHSRYQCGDPSITQPIYLLDYVPNKQDCIVSHSQLKQGLTIGILVAVFLVVCAVVVTVFMCYHKICHRIKSLHYRWQIRYREVSGVEFATDPKA